MNTKPFNLEAAMNGAKLVTRDGREAKFIAYVPDAKPNCRVLVLIDKIVWGMYENGKFLKGDTSSDIDLFLAVQTRSINGYEYPEPESVGPEDATVFWLPYPPSEDFVLRFRFDNREKSHQRLLKRGLVHLTREAAEAHARAIILAGGGEV